MKFVPDHDKKYYNKAKKRLGKVEWMQVQDWAETSLWTAQEGLEASRKRKDAPAALEQTRTAVIGLLAAVDSLLDRVD